MGARVFSDAGRMVGVRPGVVNGQSSQAGPRNVNSFNENFKMEVLYDGTGTIATPNLLATEAWVDVTGFYRLGLNIGPTVQNVGQVAVSLQGVSGVPKDYVQKVATDASIVALLAPLWEDLDATLAVGDIWKADGGVYSIFKFVFTAGGYGAVNITGL